jgi:putative ABC transport system substrate-binding protein
MKRVAMVHPAEKPEEMTINGRYKPYFEALNRLGYAEGQNLFVERYSGFGRPEQYGDLARTVVASQPELIVAIGTPIALQFKSATSTIPIVTIAAAPVALGLVTNFARPEGNITGVSADAGLEIDGKRVQLLSELVRDLTNVRVLVPVANGNWWGVMGTSIGEAAQRAGISVAPALAPGTSRLAYEQSFDAMEKEQVDGLVVSDGTEHLTNRALIVQLAAQHRLPAIYAYRAFAEAGGLLAYGIDTSATFRRLADVTDQVLKGAKPGDVPFYQATKFELVLNRTTARSLGLEFPPTLLAVADEVIE